MHSLKAVALTVALTQPALAEMPALPPGLGGQPELPPGLGGQPELPPGLGGQPELPPGLGGTAGLPIDPDVDGISDLELSKPAHSVLFAGFFDLRYGTRIQDKNAMPRTALGEARFHLEAGFGAQVRTQLAFDAVGDTVVSQQSLDFHAGDGAFDLREANVSFSPVQAVDLKLGRQILTWGTGDLLFINDLFPKDYESFVIGRDVDYLKAPSDALKLSIYSDFSNLDVVYTPKFDPNRYINGERVSFFSPIANAQISGTAIPVDLPDKHFSDDELALRLYRTVRAFELAVYFYDGFWKNPIGYDVDSAVYKFPKLTVAGGSLRGPVGPGIFNIELGYYDSTEDVTGSDPLTPNSQFRWMMGYEMEIARETTLGLQYYNETMENYAAYESALPIGMDPTSENREVLTARLMRSFLDQRLATSVFFAGSPTDEDGHIRGSLSYSFSDHLSLNAGINYFFGKFENTSYGQFQDDGTVYFGVRASL